MKHFYNSILAAFAFLFFLTSCSRAFDEDIKSLIIGEWVCSSIDNKEVILDETFASCYDAQGKELYAEGTVINENNKKWGEMTSDYSIDGGKIIVTNKAANNEIHMKVVTIGTQEMKYVVTKLILGGETITDNHTYVMKKSAGSIKTEILGRWQGRNVTQGATDTKPRQWEYKADGTYVYYTMQLEGKDTTWVSKVDNEGKYFTYGELLATNWTNDDASGVDGTMYECWEVEITKEGVMNWKGRRADDKFAYFTMKRVK